MTFRWGLLRESAKPRMQFLLSPPRTTGPFLPSHAAKPSSSSSLTPPFDPDIAGEDSGYFGITCRVGKENMTAISAPESLLPECPVRIKNAYCAAEERTIPSFDFACMVPLSLKKINSALWMDSSVDNFAR